MILSMIGIGLASIVLWLLRLYVLGGRARLGGRPLDPTDKLFPPLSKEVEEELDRRRKALAEKRKAKQEAMDSKGPPKNFFEEAEEYIAKRKMEAEERKRKAAARKGSSASKKRVTFTSLD